MKKCIRCGSTNTKVYESRVEDGYVVRRRECSDCGCRYKTIEVDYWDYTNMIRKDDD